MVLLLPGIPAGVPLEYVPRSSVRPSRSWGENLSVTAWRSAIAERWAGVRRGLRGLGSDPKFGSLPALLLTLTVVTGLVDAVSILRLGRVFVANMTGNVVFIGFAVAGARGFSLGASLVALGGFLLGAGSAGRLVRRSVAGRARVFSRAILVQSVFVAAALCVALVAPRRPGAAVIDVIAGVLAVGMGIQNASVRWLGVPDLTTTVLTMTLTGIVADDGRSRSGAPALRRLLAVGLMLGGAVVGATLVLDVSVAAALATALGLIVVVVAASRRVRLPDDGDAPGAKPPQGA